MSRNPTHDPRAMPILAPVDRCVPHVGNPGMPQRPELSVKLHMCKIIHLSLAERARDKSFQE